MSIVLRHNELRIGSRTSALALWQTNHVMRLLAAAWPGLECCITPFVTQGDKILDKALPAIGGKGLFTAELEAALLDKRIDLAVHSLKDLPVENAPGVMVGAISKREDPRDVLVCTSSCSLDTLPAGAVVGTSSTRRQAQLLARRPDLVVKPIRGNVETRMRKVQEGHYDATLLAAAGVKRLGLEHAVHEWLDFDVMLPAPGQAALAVQCRSDDEKTLAYLSAVHHHASQVAVSAERLFLAAMGGGCSAPIAAYARATANILRMSALVGSIDGRKLVRVEGTAATAEALAGTLAASARRQGALELLEHG